jgi:serine-type D-Ala-D-Ala carboxypeptidase/endopeptidase (penicillin-binding protein 4)
MRKKKVAIRNSFALYCLSLLLFSSSCNVQKRIAKSAQKEVITTAALQTAHVGISLYDPATGKYLYNYQGDKYFVPASNTKIPTCYAAMKYLGDSSIAFRYRENDTAIYLYPAADPSLLHADFNTQPAIKFLQGSSKKIYITDKGWKEKPLGYGWSWDDYNDSYMAERSSLPVYGNIIKWVEVQTTENLDEFKTTLVPSVFSEPAVAWEMTFAIENKDSAFFVRRDRDKNVYTVYEGKEAYKEQEVPFVTNGLTSALELLSDTIGKSISELSIIPPLHSTLSIVHSQPIDSILKPMMHRSDNFFAEQSLLMVSNEKLGIMNDEAIIDTLLKTDLANLPQKPRWVDGSGLSRYNLFTPQDMVFILDKMQREFGMDRLKTIFPTGGEGTLGSYYKTEKGYIYAKTGTLSGVVSISGYLYTKKGKLLIFSVLVNNHTGSATSVRRSVEEFLKGLR